MIPLSFAQRRLWFIHRLDGPSAAYNMPVAVRLTGTFDEAAFAAAVGDVVSRHESLRTLLVESDGEPGQRVLDADGVEVPVSIADVPPAEVDAAVERACGYPFDLSAEIPIRVTVLRCGAADHVVLLLLHHVAGDGWSMAPLLRDLSLAYAARRRGEAPRWEPLPVQYVDYTLWQRELLGSSDDPGSVLSQQFDYWRRELDGLPEQLALPADRPRPRTPSYRGDIAVFAIDADIRAAVERLAAREGATVSMVLQSALDGLLFKLGAGQDIPIGSPIAGRTDEALADWSDSSSTPGSCARPSDPAESFARSCARSGRRRWRHTKIRTPRSNCWSNCSIPLAPRRIIRCSRSRSHSRTTPRPGWNCRRRIRAVSGLAGDRTVRPAVQHRRRTRGRAWDGLVEFATELFDRSTSRRWRARLVRLLGQAASIPTCPWGRSTSSMPASGN